VPYNPSLPRPTGPSPVGVRDVHLVDAARQEPLASPPGPRELMARVYYPAAARPAGGASLRDHAVAPYVSEPIALEWGREQSRMLGVRSDAVNWQFRTNAHLHTPP